jgi:hypothetical protein
MMNSENLKSKFVSNLPNLPFLIMCWTFGLILILNTYKYLTFDSTIEVTNITFVLFFIGLGLMLFPFFKSIKIGKILEIERATKENKEELSSFKNEVRQTISLISTNVNTIGNLTNQVTINFPGITDLKEANENIKSTTDFGTEEEVKEIQRELILDDEDNIFALARTRISLEYLLRKILDKRTSIKGLQKEIKFLSLSKLYRMFLKDYPEYDHLANSFDYVISICNAAVHAQRVSVGQATEALQLGARIIAVLNKLNR